MDSITLHLSPAELLTLAGLTDKYPESNITLIADGYRVVAHVWAVDRASELARVVLG